MFFFLSGHHCERRRLEFDYQMWIKNTRKNGNYQRILKRRHDLGKNLIFNLILHLKIRFKIRRSFHWIGWLLKPKQQTQMSAEVFWCCFNLKRKEDSLHFETKNLGWHLEPSIWFLVIGRSNDKNMNYVLI